LSRMSELLPADYTYPAAPGFKVAGPSEHAAKAMTGKAAKMREAVLAQIAQYRGALPQTRLQGI
jgi:hypothetical protein